MGALLLALQIPRPFESIINIYCPWHPETSASPNSRITVLDGLRKRYMDLARRLVISILPESHELHIPTHESDYRDWKLDQPRVKIVEYADFLADVVMRLITDADAEVGRWKEFLEKAFQLPPTDRARVYNALELSGLNVRLQNRAWRARHGGREIQAGKVANVLIGIGAIFIANYPYDEGACNQLLNFLRLLPTPCYFDRR